MTKKSGFTLIEVMSSTAILSIILLGAVSVFTTSLLSQSKARVRRMLKLEGQQMLATIEYELKNAQAIADCTGDTSQLVYTRVGDLTNTSYTLNFTTPTITLNNAALNSSKVTVVAPNIFKCETSPVNQAQFVTVKFDLTNAQTGEIRTDAGSITESFRTGVAVRNFKTN